MGEMNIYTIYIDDNDYYEVRASYFYFEEKCVVFANKIEVNVDKFNSEKIAVVPIDSFRFIVDNKFEIIRDD